jgi:tripartite-type tricarboxylate transporter receptor subunit TctC
VRIIVPFAAGGPGDIFARLIGQKLSEQLGQQFFIENRPGASGNIGTAVAARAPADGYTLMVGSSAVWINASLYPQIPYDPVKDFDPIIIGATSPEVLVVHPSVPARSVQELVTLVRAGKYTNFAIAGVGTPPHLSTELFKLSLKLDIVMVPFGGGGPMVQSVVAGHTPVAFSTLPAASGQIKDGLLAGTCGHERKAHRDTSRRADHGRSRRTWPSAGGAAMRVGTHGHTRRHHRPTLPRNRACGRLAGRQEENGGNRLRAGCRAAR